MQENAPFLRMASGSLSAGALSADIVDLSGWVLVKLAEVSNEVGEYNIRMQIDLARMKYQRNI